MASFFRPGENNSSFDYDASLHRLCTLMEQQLRELQKLNDRLTSLDEDVRDIKEYVREAKLEAQVPPWRDLR